MNIQELSNKFSLAFQDYVCIKFDADRATLCGDNIVFNQLNAVECKQGSGFNIFFHLKADGKISVELKYDDSYLLFFQIGDDPTTVKDSWRQMPTYNKSIENSVDTVIQKICQL